MEITDFLFTPVGYTLFLALAVLYFLWKSTKVSTYWQDKGVPYVKPLPLFGSILENLKKPLHELELERYKKHGAVYGYYTGAAACLSIGDPKLLRKILVKDFQFFPDRRALDTGDAIPERMLQQLQGEDWKRVRTIITPTFTSGKIKRMMDIFKSCSKVLIKNFSQSAESGTPVNTKKLYGAFTMDVIASAAFSTKLDSHNDPNNTFVRIARNVFQGGVNWRFIFYLLFPRLLKLFKVPIWPPEGIKFFAQVTLEIIKERERTGQKGNDFLQLLIDTAKEQSDELEASDKKDEILRNYEGENNDQVFKNYVGKKSHLTFNELVAQCVIFFLAGFETTAGALAFSTYHLALNEDVQEKLIREIDDALKSNDGKMTYEGIQNMKYLDNVISETLRISPPAVRLDRRANEDYELEGTGITIPKGTHITVPVYALHNDPKYFPEPEKFDPERFTPEAKANREPFTFMPFGAGPRNCVGMRFALVEAKVCLAYVLSHFRIKRCPETKVPLDYYMSHGLLQPKEITVKLIKRKDCPVID